jgi:hypothetical protein
MKRILVVLLAGAGLIFLVSGNIKAQSQKDIVAVLRSHILDEAGRALKEEPVTITAAASDRSAGGKHDFYSEGDYWWPDLQNPEGPYIQRDGMTNPDNFVAHRKALIRFSRIIGCLASAYKITQDDAYVKRAIAHLHAWFVDTTTMMRGDIQGVV